MFLLALKPCYLELPGFSESTVDASLIYNMRVHVPRRGQSTVAHGRLPT